MDTSDFRNCNGRIWDLSFTMAFSAKIYRVVDISYGKEELESLFTTFDYEEAEDFLSKQNDSGDGDIQIQSAEALIGGWK